MQETPDGTLVKQDAIAPEPENGSSEAKPAAPLLSELVTERQTPPVTVQETVLSAPVITTAPSTPALPPAPPSPLPPAPSAPRRRWFGAPRRSGLVARLSGGLSFILFLGLGLLGTGVFLDNRFSQPGPLASDRVLVIGKGDGSDEITDQLAREGVIVHPATFWTAIHAFGLTGQLKAGEYLFKSGASMREVIETLIEGKGVLHPVTIPEGLTSEQVMARLAESDVLSGEVRETPREGTLLPDTYKVERGMTRDQVVLRMSQAQRKVLAEVWARRAPDLPIKTPQELMILASIVEKETARADERTRIAGVFINRLLRRMRLQSDPTIVYGIVGGKGTLGRSILRSEIDQMTPYNTYAIDGLPPGPIANPGRSAMEAVANPSRTRDLYFVADGTGGHVFAETLDQHQRNVVRWRQIEASRKEGEKAIDRVEPSTGQVRGDLSQEKSVADAGESEPQPVITVVKPPRPKGFDAVEGTARDPLLNRTFDLNSPKTVPVFRP